MDGNDSDPFDADDVPGNGGNGDDMNSGVGQDAAADQLMYDDASEQDVSHSEESEQDDESDMVEDLQREENDGLANENQEVVVQHRRFPIRILRGIQRRIRQRIFQFIEESRAHQYFEVAADSSDEDDQEDRTRPQNITFDKYLPTSHSYLGEMDDCSGMRYIDQESYIVLPILQVPDFVLVPGQTMPLDISRPQEVSLLNIVSTSNDKTFGVVLSRFPFSSRSQTSEEYGCTAELRSMREREVHEIRSMVGIAIGRQRFRIMERRLQHDGNLFAKVKILSDDELPPPVSGARLSVHRKNAISPVRTAQKRPFRSSSMLEAGWLTGCAPWSYRMYDVKILRKLIIEELRDWNPEVVDSTLPTAPSAFSFWIASHSIMTNAMRIALLKIDCSIQRLRCELNILREFTSCVCIDCGNRITEKQHLFNMSVSGPINAYVNPSGHIHETLTVYSAKGLVRVSDPSTEHSWFPGYAWTICQCDVCNRHMGWKFSATNDSLIPKVFWGLTRSALSPLAESKDSEENVDQPVPTRQQRHSSSSSVSSGSLLYYSEPNWRPML